MTIQDRIENYYPQLVKMRRQFHQHPELGTCELNTARQIMEYLDSWSVSYQYPVADTGIVAIIHGKKEGTGNTVGLRADMDALPITEDPNRSYCSQNQGVMHACGHDAHMTIALGVAWLLKVMEQEWSGCVKIFFQPAEENVGGAQRMVFEGCMENPHVDYVAGLHMTPAKEAGHIEVKYGKLNASSDDVILRIYGKGCHGAYPENGVDAIMMASSIISTLQTVVSRSISPLEQAVLTFGSIQGGTAANIIADMVEIKGTLRTTEPYIREQAIETIKRQVSHICEGYHGRGETIIEPGYDALINTDEIVDLLIHTSEAVIGSDHIHLKPYPSMGVEDFSFFLKEAPGVYYHLGCANQENGITAPLHNNRFDIDENCLKLGVRLQWELLMELLKK